MWKSKSIKAFLLSLVLSLFFVSPVFAQEDLSDLEEFQNLANSLNQESYWQEVKQIQSLTDLLLQDIYSNPVETTDQQSLMLLRNYSAQMKSSEFASKKLSEQLKVLQLAQKTSNQVMETMLNQSTSLLTWQSSTLNNMKLLLASYNRLLEITQKIFSSQQQDVQLAIEELSKTSKQAEDLKLNLNIIQSLADKQAEEITALKKVQKRIKVASYVEFGVGVPCLVLGFLPIWTDEQKNIQNLLLGIGFTGTVAGVVTFSFTIPF